MSIRRDEIEVYRPPVCRRKLMDMIKRFDPNDISYIDDYSYTPRFLKNFSSNQYPGFSSGIMWSKVLQDDNMRIKDVVDRDSVMSFQNQSSTTVQDTRSKYFVINNGTVWAIALQGDNIKLKAYFKITLYPIQTKGAIKCVITLQVQNQDLYLSCKPTDEQLKVLPLGQKRLVVTNPEVKDFFFFPTEVTTKKYSLEPLTRPGCLVGTSPDSNSRVSVVPTSDNTHYTTFAFDAKFTIGFNFVQRAIMEATHIKGHGTNNEELRPNFNQQYTEITHFPGPMWNPKPYTCPGYWPASIEM
ncbi:hypothetical protein GDO81_009235 [Engystomops pustulosus]|uniref:Interleukin-1 beta n=1 Tax=Engystomops pustulosus TaxID=76066 RepID=A0AAV7BPG0_ENGPU|nr:hypothetical protein GDO81_009235 [Engystomops pustulosus]